MGPLIAWRPARAAVALGMLAGAVGGLGFAWLWLMWLFRPLGFLGALLMAGAALPAAAAVWRGRWSERRGGVERVAVGVVLVVLLGALGHALLRASGEQRVRDLGAATEAQLGGWLAFAGAVTLAAGVLLATAPRLVPERWSKRACAAAALAAAALFAGAALVEARTSCGDVHVDRAAWRGALADDRRGVVTDGERLAAAVAECDLLDGLTRADVLALLGAPDGREGGRWHWQVGWIRDGLGPGDGLGMVVEFGRDGRVAGAALS